MRRLVGFAAALLVSACASHPPEPPQLDLEAHCRVTVDGFRDASGWVAAELDAAAAWAVFPDVGQTEPGCEHAGMLFRRSGPARPVFLVCASGPGGPAGDSFHEIVILHDPADVVALGTGPLDLATALQGSAGPGGPPAGEPSGARFILMTTQRGSYLQPAGVLHQSLVQRLGP